MEELPRERPVMERGSGVVSPDVVQRQQCLLKELYAQRSAWRKVLPPFRPPTHKETRIMLSELNGVDSLQGAKILMLDDTSQLLLKFLTHVTLATRRRVERIFYHGETVDQLVSKLRERLRRCPKPHLLIVDGDLNMLPSLEPADRTVHGYDVVRETADDLQSAGIPVIGFSTTEDRQEEFLAAGASGFVVKPPLAAQTEEELHAKTLAAVQEIARVYNQTAEQLRRKRDERFITQD